MRIPVLLASLAALGAGAWLLAREGAPPGAMESPPLDEPPLDGSPEVQLVPSESTGERDRIEVRASPATAEGQRWTVAGLTVRGRLIDAEGRGVPGTVRAVGVRDSVTVTSAFANAGADGSFVIHLRREGTFDLLADAGEAGTGAMRDVAIDGSASPETIQLRVGGPGIVRGFVRDASGRPAAGLELFVCLAALDDDQGDFLFLGPEDSRVARGEGGRTWVTRQTAADGSFEARGLRLDRYVVRVQRKSNDPRTHLLTPTPVQSDGTAHELLFDRPHIAVRLVDETGAPLPLPASSVPCSWHGVRTCLDLPEEWPEEPSIVVVPIADEAHLAGPWEFFLPARRVGDELVFEVDENRRYEVGLLGGSQLWRPTEVLVSSVDSRIEIALAASAPSPMGAISLLVSRAGQVPARSSIAVQFEDPSTSTPLVRTDSFGVGTGPSQYRLPEGEYRVVVEGTAVVDYHGRLWTPRSSGRSESLVRVAADRSTDVEVRLPEGARIHLGLRGEVLASDREAIGTGTFFFGNVESWASHASFSLLPEDGWPQPVEFTMVIEGRGTIAGTRLVSMLPLGSDSTSELLPAGRFRLEARMPGGRVASKDVVLVDGATTDVTLEFDP